jgi:glycosyltransferase involved in cell wall biosynthesis
LQKRVRIAVNTRLLIKDQLEGIGWFMYQNLKRLVQNNPEFEFYFLFDRPYDPDFIFGENVTPIVLNPPARHPILWFLWFEIAIPRFIKKHQIDLFLSLDAYTSLSAQCTKITAIHDIAFMHYENQVPKVVQWFMRHFTPKYYNSSDVIITVSEASKQDLISTFGAHKKIEVLYNAASDIYKPIEEAEKTAHKNQFTEGCPYFLYVGSIHPRKNVLNLLKSFEAYKEKYQTNHYLVLVGRWAWQSKEAFDFLQNMQNKNLVKCVAHQTPENLRYWYGAAEALVFISIYEGFGIPIVEAMACEAPIIASRSSSLPEVGGEAAIYVEPESIEEIVEALHQIQNQEVRNKLIANGKLQILKFDWNQSAKKLEAIVKQELKL